VLVTTSQLKDSNKELLKKSKLSNLYFVRHLGNALDSNENIELKKRVIELAERMNKLEESDNGLEKKFVTLAEHSARIEKAVITKNGYRLASKSEIKKEKPYVFEHVVRVVEYNKRRMICAIAWAVTGIEAYQKIAGINGAKIR